MPISQLVKYGPLSSAIFIGSTVAVQAQSDLPGCVDDVVKRVAIEIVIENIEREIRKNGKEWAVLLDLDWQLDSFSLKYISLTEIDEQTSALTCHATLHGKRDRKYFGSDPLLAEERARKEEQGYWNYHDISAMQYTISESAENPEYFIINVIY